MNLDVNNQAYAYFQKDVLVDGILTCNNGVFTNINITQSLNTGFETISSTELSYLKNVSSNIDCFAYKHIFPGSQIPNTDWILDKSRKNGLKTIHFEGFGGQHYSKTLKYWREKIVKDKEELIKKYGIKLFNKYEYYLASTEANFKLGDMGIGHYVMVSDDNVYTSNSFNY
jgi:cyclopropane fatty-acyl-phospholipid synthase-like methyltransferase